MVAVLTLLAVFFSALGLAQQEEPQEFSLEEAIAYGLENNYQSINARRDIAKALKQKWETIATGLPQINGDVSYTYNVEIPLNPIPARFIDPSAPLGQFVPVAFQARQSASLTATLQQLIFDGSYLVALEANGTFIEFSKNAENKTKLEVRKGIINAYGGVLLARENIAVITSNRDALKKNVDETQEIYNNGLAEEEDVEQLKITLAQLDNQLATARRQEDIALDMLQLALGMSLENPLVLSEDLTTLALQNIDPSITDGQLELEQNIDYRIARNFTEQRRLEYKLERAKNLPRASAFINYGVNTFDEDFVFLDTSTQWFDFSTVGVNITVPIFSSFGRRARQDRAKLAQEQALTDFERVQEEIRLNYATAVNQYQTAVDTYTTSRENLRLAERIENKNQIKFKEGLATSFDLRQAQTQLYGTQASYLNSLFALIREKAAIETLRNTPQYLSQD